MGIGIFDIFCFRDLDLDPMTFVYELDTYSLEMHQMNKNKLPTSTLSKVLADRHNQNYLPCLFAGGQ